ncbi:MAG: S-layer homology domain-containing protein, partial [Clostridia bacterium]|nr:S-layer homology domain-containing protein [Clostridia bacterium]
TVTDNIIDITDKTVYERRGLGCAKVVNIKVTDADVESASEDNTTINIVLDGNTSPDATVNVEFGTALDKNMNMSGHKATVTLSEGIASLDMTLKGQYSSISSLSGTVTYSLNFSLGEISTTPPNRIVESDSKSTYSGVAIDLNLKDYFEDAKEYYLVDGDEKTLIDGRTYTFKSFIGGTHTLVFSASNDNGACPDFVTVTVEVTEIESGAWLGIATSNGSVNFVKFTDADGNDIDGLVASLEDKNIAVTVPRTFEANGKITATFDLTQNGGLPKLSTSNAFNGSNDTKVYNTTLTNGMGKVTMYLYNAHPKATSNNYTTYTVSYAIENEIPALAEGQEKSFADEIFAGESFTLDLAPIFTDADGDELTYSVKINGEAAVSADTNYSFNPSLGGTYELEFFASDSMSTSSESYKVTLTVANSTQTYDMAVLLPDDITPTFYITNGYDENGADILGDTLTSAKGESADGFAAYSVSVPENISEISVRDTLYGGMAIPASSKSSVKLCKVQTKIIDFGEKEISGSVDVSYESHNAAGVDGRYLLIPEKEYTFTASPENTSAYNKATENIALTEDINTISIKVSYKNPKTIITTTGATAKLFKYVSNYYVHTPVEPLATVDNGDGTSTHYFTSDGNLSYRVSMDGKITKAGYLTRNSATVLHTEEDKLPTDRVDYSSAGTDASAVADDSVLININQQNHLSLPVGQTKTIKAYRAWQIVNNTTANHIIEPDFNFNIISGDDVVTLTPYESQPMTNSSGNWSRLTAIGEGTAIIEVTYDAILIDGGSYSGFYGATDPARCGLFIVTVGLDVPDVDFGIESKAGAGSIVYNEANTKPWDSEFDTLYFFGESGEIKLSPTLTDGNISEVAVSHDKGKSFITLEAADSVYTAPIVSGNNIIRVITDKGTAYQIVRGDKVELSVKNITNPGKPIAAGDKVSLKLEGVHTPVPKISGTFNPGYSGNTDGESKAHIRYSFGKESVVSEGKQYDFSLNGTTMEFTVPKDSEETEFTLTDGYIGVGVIGVQGFSDDGDSHRNIPDSGSGTRDSKTTFTTRSLLPDITVSIGMLPSGNTAPFIRENAPQSATLNLGGTYALSMSRVFTDRDDDTLTYTAKVDNGEEASIEDGYYTFTPDAVGTYTIVFVANDATAESDAHTITLTVKEKENDETSSSSPEFDITDDEIAGYVKISFTDNGKRVSGEKNVTYPKALGTIISTKSVPFSEGDTIADVTLRLLDAQGFTYQYTGTTKNGFYLASIGDFTLRGVDYDSFGEFDAGSGSGWMITLNRDFIKYGASKFKVKNGDVIKWQYTCQLGEDIGDPFYSDTSSSKNNKTEEDKKEDPEKPQFTETTFADVKKNDWHYESVKYVYERGLMQGTGNSFEPESKMSRAMLVTVLYRMANAEKSENKHSFTDVPQAEWYSDAIAWAASNGIVSGVSKTEFAPDSDISREQMALIIYRFAKMQGYNIGDEADVSAFADAESVSDWALDAMKWANKTKLITGTSETTLSPKATATRSQVAAILMRFCENVAKGA